jgi:hypothetical protein
MNRFVVIMLMLSSLPALAQKEEIFGTGKPPNFREETMDRRFAKSKLAKMLATGSDEPGCVQLMGGLFVALGELAPMIHKKDENFVLDPALQEAVRTQLSTSNFPALAYLVSMVRKVMIDKRLPDEWLETAKELNKTVKIIDLGKLKLLNDGISPIDSAFYTIPLLKQRYVVEVLGANSAVTTDVVASFRDTYLDRDVAWPGAILIDAGLNDPKTKKKKKFDPANLGEMIAVLEWQPPDLRKTQLDLLGKLPAKVPPVRIIAKLNAKQYLDLEKAFRGQRLLVRGRFWEMNRDATEVELRDAQLFDDRDWSQGVILANPADVARCSAALNELTGTVPQQPGGFGH